MHATRNYRQLLRLVWLHPDDQHHLGLACTQVQCTAVVLSNVLRALVRHTRRLHSNQRYIPFTKELLKFLNYWPGGGGACTCLVKEDCCSLKWGCVGATLQTAESPFGRKSKTERHCTRASSAGSKKRVRVVIRPTVIRRWRRRCRERDIIKSTFIKKMRQ